MLASNCTLSLSKSGVIWQKREVVAQIQQYREREGKQKICLSLQTACIEIVPLMVKTISTSGYFKRSSEESRCILDKVWRVLTLLLQQKREIWSILYYIAFNKWPIIFNRLSPRKNRSWENHSKTPEMASEIGSVSSEINFSLQHTEHDIWHKTQKTSTQYMRFWLVFDHNFKFSVLKVAGLPQPMFQHILNCPSPCRVSKGGFLIPE